jgi:hypothetical protein
MTKTTNEEDDSSQQGFGVLLIMFLICGAVLGMLFSVFMIYDLQKTEKVLEEKLQNQEEACATSSIIK